MYGIIELIGISLACGIQLVWNVGLNWYRIHGL